jgi:hypothetical protein
MAKQSSRSVKFRIGPLKIEKTLGQPVPMSDSAGVKRAFDQLVSNVERANNGDSMREYIAYIHNAATEVFKAERIEPHPVGIRCQQIIHEYEDPKWGLLSDADFDRAAKRLSPGTPRPLRKIKISEFLYCAAAILVEHRTLEVTMRNEQPNPWVLAANCMRLAEAYQRLLFALGTNREGRTINARKQRTEEATKRQDALLARANETGSVPANNADTRLALGYSNASSGSARKLFARDLEALRKSRRLRE